MSRPPDPPLPSTANPLSTNTTPGPTSGKSSGLDLNDLRPLERCRKDATCLWRHEDTNEDPQSEFPHRQSPRPRLSRCSAHLASYGLLMKHVKRQHADSSISHRCCWGTCYGQTFPSASQLYEHINSVHFRELYFACPHKDCHHARPTTMTSFQTHLNMRHRVASGNVLLPLAIPHKNEAAPWNPLDLCRTQPDFRAKAAASQIPVGSTGRLMPVPSYMYAIPTIRFKPAPPRVPDCGSEHLERTLVGYRSDQLHPNFAILLHLEEYEGPIAAESQFSSSQRSHQRQLTGMSERAISPGVRRRSSSGDSSLSDTSESRRSSGHYDLSNSMSHASSPARSELTLRERVSNLPTPLDPVHSGSDAAEASMGLASPGNQESLPPSPLVQSTSSQGRPSIPSLPVRQSSQLLSGVVHGSGESSTLTSQPQGPIASTVSTPPSAQPLPPQSTQRSVVAPSPQPPPSDSVQRPIVESLPLQGRLTPDPVGHSKIPQRPELQSQSQSLLQHIAPFHSRSGRSSVVSIMVTDRSVPIRPPELSDPVSVSSMTSDSEHRTVVPMESKPIRSSNAGSSSGSSQTSNLPIVSSPFRNSQNSDPLPPRSSNSSSRHSWQVRSSRILSPARKREHNDDLGRSQSVKRRKAESSSEPAVSSSTPQSVASTVSGSSAQATHLTVLREAALSKAMKSTQEGGSTSRVDQPHPAVAADPQQADARSAKSEVSASSGIPSVPASTKDAPQNEAPQQDRTPPPSTRPTPTSSSDFKVAPPAKSQQATVADVPRMSTRASSPSTVVTLSSDPISIRSSPSRTVRIDESQSSDDEIIWVSTTTPTRARPRLSGNRVEEAIVIDDDDDEDD